MQIFNTETQSAPSVEERIREVVTKDSHFATQRAMWVSAKFPGADGLTNGSYYVNVGEEKIELVGMNLFKDSKEVAASLSRVIPCSHIVEKILLICRRKEARVAIGFSNFHLRRFNLMLQQEVREQYIKVLQPNNKEIVARPSIPSAEKEEEDEIDNYEW